MAKQLRYVCELSLGGNWGVRGIDGQSGVGNAGLVGEERGLVGQQLVCGRRDGIGLGAPVDGETCGIFKLT